MKRLLRSLVGRLGTVANEETKAELTQAVFQRVDVVEDLLRHLDRRMSEFESRVTSDTQTAAEFANTFRRSTDRLRDELDRMWAWATTDAGRVVEVPWVMRVTAALPVDSLVLVVGADGSNVARSIASLGVDVVTAGTYPSPLRHPRISSVPGPLDQWSGPPRPLDAIVCMSAHEGVEAPIIERFAQWLEPGGELVFTSPFGPSPAETRFADWEIVERVLCMQTEPDTWERVEQDTAWSPGQQGVVLLRARRP